ncbi:MAG: N-acetylmuramoyl-L-alanine amidase [Kiritimatiellae bacterium]|nr:N-acetylmuramoyl-L-alanine amidase [Kiritimatiellia bacterium]
MTAVFGRGAWMLALVGAWSAPGAITVAFPAERQRLPAVEECYLIGATDPGRTELLYVNGVTTDVYRTGAFLAMVPVKPGTNVVTIFQGRDKLVRSFVVAAPSAKEIPMPEPILSDDDPRLGPPAAWQTTGKLFANRVRSEIDGGDTLYYLPTAFCVRGAEVKGQSWIAVWLEGRRGFLPRQTMRRCISGAVPSKRLIAPDPTVGFPDAPPYGRAPSTVRICVDPGHGGTDTGARTPHGWNEKDVNLMQARAIRAALEKVGFQVVMTRDDDSFPALYDRPKLAYDERVDAFISVHHNATAANRNPRVARHTTAYASTSNGLALAQCIQKHVAPVLAPVKDAGAQMRSFAVCRNPAVPSCLLEVDFINLPEGEAESWDAARQKKVANAVVMGVLDWMAPPSAESSDSKPVP